MIILLFFAFLSGLVTIFAPCIWPILPIVLSSSTSGSHRKPLGITLGIVSTFAIFTLTISYIVSIIPFDPNIIRYISVVVILFLGLTLLIPQLNQLLEGFVSRLSGKFATSSSQGTGFKSGFLTGSALGIVWTPCAGPILATIATLAATQEVNFGIILVTTAYVIGVGIPLFIFSTLGQKLFTKSRIFNKYTGTIQQIFGCIMILTALAIATNYDKYIQTKLLDAFPGYSVFLNNLESNDLVKKELDKLRGNNKAKLTEMNFPQAGKLPVYGTAPEFAGIEKWLNTDGKSVTMQELKGKVVLIDFWTYTCINCIRTLPHVTGWYEQYKDEDFVIIGVHTPEFEFEKKTENVEKAIEMYNIQYPVAQDNDFVTWKAYDNHYWPAKYLIDAEGKIRYYHFGEGKYEETEEAIRSLLEEAGKKVGNTSEPKDDQTPRSFQTPETYLGLGRMDQVMNRITNTGKQNLNLSPALREDHISFGGEWDIQQEYSESMKDSILELDFEANEVFLVITPGSANDEISVYLDGVLLPNELADEDVKNGKVKLDVDRLYKLINLKGNRGRHNLRLEFSPGIQIFAFTFG